MKPLSRILRTVVAVILAVAAIAVYCYCFDTKLDLNGDNATYISLARNLASGHGYSDVGYGGEYLPASQFPPGYPFLLSLMVRMGLDSLLAFKILNGVLLLLSLAVVFLLFKGLTEDFLFAGFVTLLCILSPRLIRFATIVMSETGYMFFVLLAFFALWHLGKGVRRFGLWFWIATLSAVAAYYFRGLGLSVMGAVVVFFLFRREWLRAGVSAAAQIALIVPWSLRNRSLGIVSRYLDTVMVVNPWRPDLEQVSGTESLFHKAWINLYDTTLNGFRRILFPDSIASWNDSPNFLAVLAGFLILAVVVYGLWNMKSLRWAFLAFLAANLAIFMVWHSGNDYRYAVPYIPIVIAGFWYGLKTLAGRFVKGVSPWLVMLPLAFATVAFSFIQIRDLRRMATSGYPQAYNYYFSMAEKIQSLNPDPGSMSPVAICCRKPELFHYYAPSFYCCNYPYTGDSKEMARFFLDRKVGFVVVDMLGYSSTELFLIPALGDMVDLITTVSSNDDGSVVFSLDLPALKERYGEGI